MLGNRMQAAAQVRAASDQLSVYEQLVRIVDLRSPTGHVLRELRLLVEQQTVAVGKG
jgi:hypothetical protein